MVRVVPRRIVVGAVAWLLAGASQAADGTQVSERQYALPKCSVPVASVVVGKLACKAQACQPVEVSTGGNSGLLALARLAASQEGRTSTSFAGIGDGMAAMLTTALKETGCFDIQEREAMDELAKELQLVGKKVEVQQADFMISGAITSINLNTDRSSFGGGLIPIVGAIRSTKHTADVGVDIRVIDVNRARVLESKTFQANNETSSTSFALGAGGFGGLIGGGMSSIKGTPMEPIVRDVLAQVASFTANRLVAVRTSAAPAAPAAPAAVVPLAAVQTVAVPAAAAASEPK
jgi:curli biogenesis system outer membrane secretion channel CsgG